MSEKVSPKTFGIHLLRFESTRSYQGERQCSGTNYSEFISRYTRRLLSNRLRNVLRKASHSNISNEDEKDENDIQRKSFRFRLDDMNVTLQRNLSSINLVRSLLASMSGTLFGKLLLEDQRVVNGAHIQRKHEAFEKLIMKVKKHKRDKFNLKERVSSLKYSLGLRERLFRRKIHPSFEFHDNDPSFVKDIMNGPTFMMNFADRPVRILYFIFLAMITEVSLTSASVCSSIHEDFYRAAYSTGPTTPCALTSNDNNLPQVFET
nr:hypothetical protein [Tanacetum cinerariifolium]